MQGVDGGIRCFSKILWGCCDPRNGGGVSQSRVGGEGRGAGDSPRSDALDTPDFVVLVHGCHCIRKTYYIFSVTPSGI